MNNIVKWLAIAFALFIVFRIGQRIYRVATMPPKAPVAGERELMDATGQLTSQGANQDIARGNSAAALELAQGFSPMLQEITEKAFTGGRPGLAEGYKKRSVVVYCELRDNQCAFLVNVPELRHYKGDALKSLQEFAWLTGQQCIAQSSLKNKDLSLAVALRGAIFYGPIMIGRTTGTPTTEVEGMSGMKSLFPFFAPAPPVTPPAATPPTVPTDPKKTTQSK